MLFLKERIGKLVDSLHELIYKDEVPVISHKMSKTEERFKDIANLDTSSWEEFHSQDFWGGNSQSYWFETLVSIPESFDGECVVYEITTGCETGWDAINPQFSFYVNGYLKQGVDVNHREILLTEKAVANQQFRIIMSAFTGTDNYNIRLESKLKILDRNTEKYFYDISVPYNVVKLLRSQDKAYIQIVQALNESLNILDLRKPYTKEYYRSLTNAQELITKELYEHLADPDSMPVVCCVGHTHIDCAWLWTLAVTEDKAVRSFSTVLELMREFPEYIFMSSQPQLYKYVKKNAPEKYEEIRQRVAEGRWETDGGMFVEADCNVSSGESLVRQFMFGKRFFREEFGKENYILWLPDVFGYSAALPQIMRKCNLPYFMTTKISWNEMNKMPYDTFEWEGIDGSKVLSHFIPTRDYEGSAGEFSDHTSFSTTYNGMINPTQIKGGWERYSQKHLNEEVLNSFGYGDGGGGPTKEMLENQRRLAYGLPGCPRTKMSTARDFFDHLNEEVKDNKYLPTWVGELYLEYHRGTYTSMARNKRYNRKSEFAYQNAELYAVMDQQLNGTAYPQQTINDSWEVILRNQFHDILPGSSIKEVYDDSKVEYEGILAVNKELVTTSLINLADQVNAPVESVIVYNANSGAVTDLVCVEYPADSDRLIACDGETEVPMQKAGKHSYVFQANDVPSKGYKTFTIQEADQEKSALLKNEALSATTSKMENAFVIVEFNNKGQISRLFDKKADREVLKKSQYANVIVTYEDMPHNYDAWDVNNYYTEKSWEVDQVESMEVVEQGPARACVKITRRYLDSVITQNVYMYADSARIDIKNEIDWKENHLFMKALFPVDIHTSEATFDIQYGNVKRPTHYNTSWDVARFEVCMNKWLDVSEDGYGISILNDCKYGCSVHDGVIGVSMLKCATYPNPDADKEFHEFTYSIYPHTGDWKAAGTVAEAYKLNNPLTAVVKKNGSGNLAPQLSVACVEEENIVIEVVKKAEDSEDMIIRLYECYNRRTKTELKLYAPIKHIAECNLMEEEDVALEATGDSVQFEIKPYEIKTFKVQLK